MSEVDQHLLRLRNENIGYDTRKNNDTSSNFTVEFYKKIILD